MKKLLKSALPVALIGGLVYMIASKRSSGQKAVRPDEIQTQDISVTQLRNITRKRNEGKTEWGSISSIDKIYFGFPRGYIPFDRFYYILKVGNEVIDTFYVDSPHDFVIPANATLIQVGRVKIYPQFV